MLLSTAHPSIGDNTSKWMIKCGPRPWLPHSGKRISQSRSPPQFANSSPARICLCRRKSRTETTWAKRQRQQLRNGRDASRLNGGGRATITAAVDARAGPAARVCANEYCAGAAAVARSAHYGRSGARSTGIEQVAARIGTAVQSPRRSGVAPFSGPNNLTRKAGGNQTDPS